ncbi:MAG: hypothetical protein J5525_12565 [Lachnospiraceae bacterium]|nr:hypothetical protein [Lachnospiraceae bacterium]
MKIIRIPFESYLYLCTLLYEQREGIKADEKVLNRIKNEYNRRAKGKGSYIYVKDDELGGCDGNAKDGLLERRWTQWSTEDIIRILDEKGLPWKTSHAKINMTTLEKRFDLKN